MLFFTHLRDNFAGAFFPRLSEWIPAVVLTGLGWLLSVNPDLMAINPAKPELGKGYVLMLSIAQQGVWSNVMVLVGVVRIVILIINGAWIHSPLARLVMSIGCCFFWTQIMLSFAPVFGFAFAMAAGWLVQDLINIVRTSKDVGTVRDEIRRRKDYAEKTTRRQAEINDIAGNSH